MNDAIKHFKETYKGPVFVLGAGPSLKNLPDHLNGTVIAVNSSILKYPNADFYFTNDARVFFRKHWEKVVSLKKTVCVLQQQSVDAYLNWRENPPDGLLTEPNRIKEILQEEFPITDERLFTFTANQDRNNPISKEDTQLIRAGSSAHLAVHFAYLIGGDPIILLGCDCCMLDGKKY